MALPRGAGRLRRAKGRLGRAKGRSDVARGRDERRNRLVVKRTKVIGTVKRVCAGAEGSSISSRGHRKHSKHWNNPHAFPAGGYSATAYAGRPGRGVREVQLKKLK